MKHKSLLVAFVVFVSILSLPYKVFATQQLSIDESLNVYLNPTMPSEIRIPTASCATDAIRHTNSNAKESETSALSYNILSSTDKTVEVVANKYGRYEGDIVIPEKVKIRGIAYTVVRIGDHAFDRCDNLTSITIPNSVTTIGDYAFACCGNLTSITIPNSVTTIGDQAFASCIGLTSIIIPNSVTTIGIGAFFWCTRLTSIIIPNTVTTIELGAFQYCISLTSINIPDSVTTIGEVVFYKCNSLMRINVDAANQVYSSKEGVLYNKKQTSLICCPEGKLGEFIIPSSVTTIGYAAFSNCSSLTSIIIPSSVTTIGYAAFSHCSSLTSITIPDSVTTIGESVFSWCSSLMRINVDTANQVYSSKNGILYNKEHTSLVSCPGGKPGVVIIPSSVTIIGEGAFSTCSSLTSIIIPSSVTIIGEEAFSTCSSLTSITIPDSVTIIGEGAFSSCSSLTSITIPDSVTTIGEGAFSWCSNLMRINVDAANQVYSSKNGILYNKEHTRLISCPGGKLGEVIIPNSVTTIGYAAFSGCTDLTSITIPNSVTTIGHLAFGSCLSLTSVTSLAVTPPECDEYAFNGVDKNNCTLYVPAKSIRAYKQVKEWNDFVKIETVEDAGIDVVEDVAVGVDEVYNLMGVKVADSLDNLPAGIYIVNGHKVMVK